MGYYTAAQTVVHLLAVTVVVAYQPGLALPAATVIRVHAAAVTHAVAAVAFLHAIVRVVLFQRDCRSPNCWLVRPC